MEHAALRSRTTFQRPRRAKRFGLAQRVRADIKCAPLVVAVPGREPSRTRSPASKERILFDLLGPN